LLKQENISEAELKSIKGTGLEGRITKEDILAFVKNKLLLKLLRQFKYTPLLQLLNLSTPVQKVTKLSQWIE
jgi:2-oxoglutarate dehydrogenase E2 component (dihydrolipoamide succinyltransferase)